MGLEEGTNSRDAYPACGEDPSYKLLPSIVRISLRWRPKGNRALGGYLQSAPKRYQRSATTELTNVSKDPLERAALPTFGLCQEPPKKPCFRRTYCRDWPSGTSRSLAGPRMTMREADFTTSTKNIIAARAGYRCSYPECDQATTGPGPEQIDVETKGVAAHIFAASEGGPRGTDGLSVAQRQSATNGIWLCADHARLVDSTGGRNYPASLLQAWKSWQEQRIDSELRKVQNPALGW